MRLSERFINAIDDDGVISSENAHVIEDAVNFIRKYEDAEEQGLLVRLPCKVWDTVFRIWNGEIKQYQVVSVWFNDHIKRRFHAECIPFLRFYDEDIGKSVFLTREEAEAALKGEREDV